MGFEIDKNGFWINPTLEGHCFDLSLANSLVEIFKKLNIKRIVDFGCGPGLYVRILKDNKFYVEGYDGNPHTPAISKKILNDGTYCKQLDLTTPINFIEPFECVLSLEVGEHIPLKYESIFLDNIALNTSKYLVLSWALIGQTGDGHINCRDNDYIIKRMSERGFTEDLDSKYTLRSKATLEWFKKTIMVFKKEH